jgi:regulator of replication initiation timing
MEKLKNNEPMLYEKYEALLNGVCPAELKDHILHDKIALLIKQNSILENTILSLRHELSNMIAKQDRQASNMENKAAYSPVSSALKKSLEVSEFEVSSFAEIHARALEAVKASGEGFTVLVDKMKSKLFPPNKKLLEFMGSVLDQVQEIRSQLASIHNYVTILEYNEKALRDSLNCSETRCAKSRSHSASRVDQFERPEVIVSKKYTRTLILDSPSTKNSMEFKNDDLQSKVSTLKIALGKMKNSRDSIEIDNQKLLLQLKQAKEQLALCEENSAAREVAYKNKIKKLTSVMNSLRRQAF